MTRSGPSGRVRPHRGLPFRLLALSLAVCAVSVVATAWLVVRSIGIRTTIIEDAGGNLKIVNNSDIRNIQNRSRNTSLAISRS